MSFGRTLLVVVGVIMLIVGLAIMAGGGALLFSNQTLKDQEGFYSTRTIKVKRDSHAVTTLPAEIHFGPAWFLDWTEAIAVKVEGENKDPSRELFIGIGNSEQVSEYLRDATIDEIRNFRMYHPFSKPAITYRRVSGNTAPADPTAQTFWKASAKGTGPQIMKWNPEEGNYVLVIMNANGSRGLNFEGSLGVKIPLMSGLTIGLLVGGFIIVLFAFLLVYLAVRTRSWE